MDIEQALNKVGTDAYGLAVTLKVTDEVSFTNASNLLTAIAKGKKQVVDYFAPILKKMNEAKKEVTTRKADLLKPFEDAEANLRPEVTNWIEMQERMRQEEQERLRKEEEEARLKIAEKLSEEGKDEMADLVMEHTAMPVVPPAPKPQGISTRKVLSIEVTNMQMLAKAVVGKIVSEEILAVNEDFIKNAVKRRGIESVQKIPGVQVSYKPSLVVRGR